MSRLDINKDGYLSREDYELMGKRLAKYSGMTEEQADFTHKEFMKVADNLHLKPGVKLPLEEAAKKAQEAFIAMAPDERVTSIHSSHNMVFDAVDTNKDGHISVNEFKAYFQVIAPEISEAEVLHSFDTIDTNKNGEISREEFLAAAVDFFAGFEKTDLSTVFFGRVLD